METHNDGRNGRRALVCAAFLAIVWSPVSGGVKHIWVDSTGRSRVVAEFVKLEGDVVTLRRTNGRTYEVPLGKLNAVSQAKAKRLAAAAGPAPDTGGARPAPRTRTVPGGGGRFPLPAGLAAVVPAKIDVPGPIHIPAPATGSTMVTYASRKGPYVSIDSTIWEIPTGRVLGRNPLAKMVHAPDRALSPDGMQYALCSRIDGVPSIEVAKTGTTTVRTIPLGDKGFFRSVWFGFLDNKRLAWAGWMSRFKGAIVFDVDTGQKLHAISLKGHPKSGALHPGGSVLALSDGRRVFTLDLEKGRIVSDTAAPSSRMYNMAFSPDGRELAVTYNSGMSTGLRILAAKGGVVLDATIPSLPGGTSPHQQAIQWLPGGKALLVGYEYLLDRQTGLVVWRPHRFNRAMPPIVVLNDAYVLLFRKGAKVTLETCAIPHEKIAQGLAAMKQAPSVLGPGKSVSLDIRVGAVRFDSKANVARQIRHVIEKRLADNRLTVGEGADLVMRIDYSEAGGPGTNVVEGTGPGARVVGKTRQTGITCAVSLVTRSGDVLWQGDKKMGPVRYGQVSSTKERDLRKSAVSSIMRELGRLDLPYFVPKDKSLPCMPIVSPAP